MAACDIYVIRSKVACDAKESVGKLSPSCSNIRSSNFSSVINENCLFTSSEEISGNTLCSHILHTEQVGIVVTLGKYSGQISEGTSLTKTKVFRGFPHSLQQNAFICIYVIPIAA
jgi:hypothetical protein